MQYKTPQTKHDTRHIVSAINYAYKQQAIRQMTHGIIRNTQHMTHNTDNT